MIENPRKGGPLCVSLFSIRCIASGRKFPQTAETLWAFFVDCNGTAMIVSVLSKIGVDLIVAEKGYILRTEQCSFYVG